MVMVLNCYKEFTGSVDARPCDDVHRRSGTLRLAHLIRRSRHTSTLKARYDRDGDRFVVFRQRNRTIGVRRQDSPYCLVLSNDLEVQPGALQPCQGEVIAIEHHQPEIEMKQTDRPDSVTAPGRTRLL